MPRRPASPSLGEERRREIAFAQVGQDDDDQLAGVLGLARRPGSPPTTAAPQEMPQSIPSSRASRRVISNASSSRTVTTSSMTSSVEHVGDEPGADALDLVRARA